MKKHLVNILIGLLLGVALVFFTSCRTIQRSRSVADSSNTRTEASAERWAREVVTEYIPTSGGPGGAPLGLPTISVPSWLPLQFVRNTPADTVRVPVPGPVRILRQIVRESGEKQVEKTEEKTAAVREKETERGWSPIQERALLLVSWGFVLLGVALVLYMLVRLFRPERPVRSLSNRSRA